MFLALGFIIHPHKSIFTPTQRLVFLGFILDVEVVYIDMSKAFDKVCYHRLLSKLRKFGFGGKPSSMVPIISHGPWQHGI